MSLPGPDVTAALPARAELLGDATSMDAVTLHVGDLAAMTSYYAQALGLQVLAEGSDPTTGRGEVTLGRGTTPAIRLVHTPGLPRPSRREAGLFHTALLMPDQATLAATVWTAAGDPRSRFVGSSDHHVSEAFYFTDPEDNGIELYVDRPRAHWSGPSGALHMTTEYLDPNAYLRAHLDETTVSRLTSAEIAVGHVHLQVGDIATARSFYSDALGFSPTVTEYPGALFVSAGGYHHHLGLNVWNSAGAPARAATLGLGEVLIRVADRAEVEAAGARLRHAGHQVHDDGAALTTADPWGSLVRIAPASHA